GPAARRPAIAAASALRTRRRLRLARTAPLLAGAALGDLLGLGRHRPVEIFEAELVAALLVLDQDDADMAAALEPAEQHLVGERLLDMLLDHARHRPRAHQLVIAVADQPARRL